MGSIGPMTVIAMSRTEIATNESNVRYSDLSRLKVGEAIELTP